MTGRFGVPSSLESELQDANASTSASLRVMLAKSVFDVSVTAF